MSERVYEGFARVEELPIQGMITIRGDLADKGFAKDLAKVAGVAVPDRGQVATKGTAGMAWMSPDEALLLLPHEDVAAMVDSLASLRARHHTQIADVSDARAYFRLEGEKAREVLMKLTPSDVSAAGFAPGQFRRTRLAQVAGAIWCRGDDAFDIVCFQSVRDYVWDLLSTSAAAGTSPGILKEA